MQERNLTHLMDIAFGEKPVFETEQKLKQIAFRNKEAVNLLNNKVNQADKYRSPSEEELEDMRQFMINYKKNNKNAPKREIRRATQQAFNIKIFRSPHKK